MDINDVLESENGEILMWEYILENGKLDLHWENLFLEIASPQCVWYYINGYMKCRSLRWENKILMGSHAPHIYDYIKEYIKGRWIEAEPILKEWPYYWGLYNEHFRYK